MRSLPSFTAVFALSICGDSLCQDVEQNNCVLDVPKFGSREYDSCITRGVLDFRIYWSLNREDDTLEIAFEARDDGWHSIGFSSELDATDDTMVGANAVFGCADFIDRTSNAGPDYLLGGYRNADVVSAGNQELLDYDEVRENGRCAVRFVRPVAPRKLDENQHLVDALRTVIVASGEATFGFHEEKFASFQVNFHTGGGFTGVAERVLDPILVAHSVLMAVAFGLCFPFGILSARHKAVLYRGKVVVGKKLWFHLHRVSMILGALLSTAGFVAIMIREGAFYADFHSVLGIIVVALIYAQFTFVRLRPKGPESGETCNRARRRWNLAHWWNGRTAAFLGYVNSIIGFLILNPPVVYWALFFLVSGFFVITLVVLDVWKCYTSGKRPFSKFPGVVNGETPEEPANSVQLDERI